MIYHLGKLYQLNVGKWQRHGVWEEINHTLRRETRILETRHPEPTAAVVDSYGGKNNGQIAGRYMAMMAVKK
ncbi:MAG: transposase [Okeania sp. SIO2D1]|nr:transposase [Okeania sp. SIO2D1]